MNLYGIFAASCSQFNRTSISWKIIKLFPGLIIGIVIKMRSYQDKAQRGTAFFFFLSFRYNGDSGDGGGGGGGCDDGARDGEIFYMRVGMQF